MTFLLAVSISAHVDLKLLFKEVEAAERGPPRWSDMVPIERNEQTPQEIKVRLTFSAKHCHASLPEAEIERRDVRAPVWELHVHDEGSDPRSQRPRCFRMIRDFEAFDFRVTKNVAQHYGVKVKTMFFAFVLLYFILSQ